MAKKGTKKVATKPVKKASKVKESVTKKATPERKSSQKTGGVAKKMEKPIKKGTAAKSTKMSEEKSPVSVPKTMIESAPTKKAQGDAKKSKSQITEVPKASKLELAKPEKEASAPVEIGVIEAEDEMPSKKAKKYEGANEEESRWLELRDKHKNIRPQPYKMSESYQEKTPIEHKTLGWGFVLSVVNDRLEVLFRSGIKHLISNYKPNT